MHSESDSPVACVEIPVGLGYIPRSWLPQAFPPLSLNMSITHHSKPAELWLISSREYDQAFDDNRRVSLSSFVRRATDETGICDQRFHVSPQHGHHVRSGRLAVARYVHERHVVIQACPKYPLRQALFRVRLSVRFDGRSDCAAHGVSSKASYVGAVAAYYAHQARDAEMGRAVDQEQCAVVPSVS